MEPPWLLAAPHHTISLSTMLVVYNLSLKYVPTVPVVGVGKEGRTLIGPWGYLNRKLAFIELPSELLALCRFSVVNAIGNVNA